MGPAGYPSDAQPWPGTDTYGSKLNQHYYNNGFWFNRILSGNSRYYFTMEGLVTRTSAPMHHVIGAQGVNPLTPVLIDILNGSDHNQQFFETTGRTDSPDRSSDVVTTGTGAAGTFDFPIFSTQDAGILQQHFGSGGARASWGWWNPDGSGFTAQAFWQDKARSNAFYGDDRIILDINSINFNATDYIRPWFGLPLPGTDRDEDTLRGVVVPYDLFVDFRFWSQIYGGNVDWYFSPVYESSTLTVKPVTGVRYLTINESFQFTGADSGMGYTVDIGNANNDLVVTTLDGGFATPRPFGSYLMSRTESQVAGPEAGFRVDIGSQRTKIWLQSKFGLLANYNKRNVNGYGIGDHYNILTTDPDDDGDGFPDNPLRVVGRNGSRFDNSATTTTISPMFEQGVFVQAPILSYVPIIKKMSVFDKAEFQAGYTILMLGNMSRPNNTIEWQQYPNYPRVGNGRSLYYTTNWSFGVQWNY